VAHRQARTRLADFRRVNGTGIRNVCKRKLFTRKRSINHALARGAGFDARADVYGSTSSMVQGNSAS